MHDKVVFINKVFSSILNAKTISELIIIPNECGIQKKYQMNSDTYPKIHFQISDKEIGELRDSGLLDADFNLVKDASNRLKDPVSKLLYALAWKNGDLKKLKHIVKGVMEAKVDTSNRNEAFVFHQFGKFLTGEKQPIIDQHVLRAFGIYQASKNNIDWTSYLTMNTVNRSHKELIQLYKVWLRSDKLSLELKASPEYTYHIDKILFAAGKAVKRQSSFSQVLRANKDLIMQS